MAWVLTRETVVALAILGALISLAAMMLVKRGLVSEQKSSRLNALGYGITGVSILLFIIIGIRGPAG